MTDLERRALMGDKKAQEECTEKGIVLPCPYCGSMKIIDHLEPYVWFRCASCGCESMINKDKRSALQAWNTRTPPPIGRCGTCDWWGAVDGPMACDITDADDYCSQYEQREEP